jgi:hypothetical protein
MNSLMILMKELKQVICPECHKKFQQLLPTQVYCSRECFYKAKAQPEISNNKKDPEPRGQERVERPKEAPGATSPGKKAQQSQSAKKTSHSTWGSRMARKRTKLQEPNKEPGVLTDSLGRTRSPHRYKYGKQEELLTFQDIQERMENAMKDLTLEGQAYFWLLYYCGVRKSEGYERVVEDAQVTESLFIIDFHQRKKHGSTVPPLKLPRAFPGVDLLCQQLLSARQRKPHRKLLIYSPEKGRKETKIVRAQWLFPRINRTWADHIVKTVLGKEYYPHFLRLNRLTEIGSDESASLTRLKSFSGIRSIKAMEAYLGVTEKEQDAAIEFMQKQIDKNPA